LELERERDELDIQWKNLESAHQSQQKQPSKGADIPTDRGGNIANAVTGSVVDDGRQKSEVDGSTGIDRVKQKAVRDAMVHAWNGYKSCAWGRDEVRPLSCGRNDWMDLGLSITDSLDTLWIMGLKEQFNEGREWVREHLSFNIDRSQSLFETNIRVLGGMLTCYELSGEKLFLDKAIDLGRRFLPAFNTPSGIPMGQINLKT
jgi:mannosyl-oligosaccharide alpha-1,2-mannosidase